MWHSIEYGIGAGALVGIAAISNFHKNIGENKDTQNVYRGMSWGLYGGILLGIYITYILPNNNTKPSAQPSPDNQEAPAELPPDQQSLVAPVSIAPYAFNGQITGGILSIRLAQF